MHSNFEQFKTMCLWRQRLLFHFIMSYLAEDFFLFCNVVPVLIKQIKCVLKLGQKIKYSDNIVSSSRPDAKSPFHVHYIRSPDFPCRRIRRYYYHKTVWRKLATALFISLQVFFFPDTLREIFNHSKNFPAINFKLLSSTIPLFFVPL